MVFKTPGEREWSFNPALELADASTAVPERAEARLRRTREPGSPPEVVAPGALYSDGERGRVPRLD